MVLALMDLETVWMKTMLLFRRAITESLVSRAGFTYRCESDELFASRADYFPARFSAIAQASGFIAKLIQVLTADEHAGLLRVRVAVRFHIGKPAVTWHRWRANSQYGS